MIVIEQWSVQGTGRGSRGSLWRARALGYHADSRSGATYALARVLVAAGVPDQLVEVYDLTEAGVKKHYPSMRYKSLVWMSEQTITEGSATAINIKPFVEIDPTLVKLRQDERETADG